MAELLGLTDLLERRPAALSGGQRQRVAMGRAIVREPQAFLMDEPLSNLDAKLRVGMRASLAQLHERLGITTTYVTHDQIEAMTLGQRVAVMRNGKMLQVDTPQRLYHEPRNLFVAAFIGSPAMNLVEAVVDGDAIVFGQFRVPLARGRRPSAGGRVVLGIRPECFEDAALAQPRQAEDRGRAPRRRGARLGRARALPRRRAADQRGVASKPLLKPLCCSPTRSRSSPRGSIRGRAARPADGSTLAVDPDAVPLLRPDDRRQPARRSGDASTAPVPELAAR